MSMFARIFRDKNFFLTLLLGAQACLEPAVTTSTGELLQEQSSSSSSVQSSSVASSSSSVTSSSSSVQSSSSSSSVTSSSSMQSSLPSSSSSSSIASSSSSVTSSSSSVTSSSSSVASSSSSVQSSSSSSSSSVPTPNPGVAYKCSSITQFGITWKFNGDYSCGNFVNGDPWVVGPVTITSITRPNGSPDKDGSMLSPSTGAEWPSQGFDNTAELGYSSSLNVARQLPNLTVAADKSLISSISISAAQRPNVDARQSIDVQAILTVVGSVPPEGSFRPAYFGVHKKPYYNINQIRYERLLSLNRNSFPNAPHANDISGAFTKPRIELGGIYKSAGLMGIQNAHGAYTSLHTSTAALVLNLNISAAEKQKLAIGLIQFGIDIYGGVIVGRQYLPSAAVQNGRKIAMLLTGILLNDPAILDRANAKKYPRDFSEDMQFGTVTQSFVTTPRKPIQGRQTDPYKAGTYVVGDVYGANGMVGMPEWGGEFTDHPEMCASNWGAYYRVYVGAPLSGAALTLKLMNIGSYWNNQAFSDYFLDRYFPIEENKTETPLFFIDIWKSIK